jgi:chromate transporter
VVHAQEVAFNALMETLVRLAIAFGVLSILGFGGGKGIIPQMQEDAVKQFHWVTSEQFAQFYTIGKLVPGPTTVFGALVGYRAAGYVGAVVAAAALFLPSSVLMIFAGAAWRRFSASPWKDVISAGLAPIVIGLVWSSVLAIGKGTVKGPASVAIALIVTALTLRTTLSAPLLIALGAAGGIVLFR